MSVRVKSERERERVSELEWSGVSNGYSKNEKSERARAKSVSVVNCCFSERHRSQRQLDEEAQKQLQSGSGRMLWMRIARADKKG